MSENNSDEYLRGLKEAQEQLLKNQAEQDAIFAKSAQKYESRLRTIKLALISVALSAVVTYMSFVSSRYFGLESNRSKLSGHVVNSESEKFATTEQLDELRSASSKAVLELAQALSEAEKSGGDVTGISLELSSLKTSIKSIDERLSVIERSISDNPEKALSIPILRKDQESMAKEIDSSRSAVSAELARIYDQQKWILGGVGTVLVAVVAALFTALFKVLFKSKDE